jgi:hypothetical protein
LIYNVDTEGYIHLVYPYDPDDPDQVEGGRTYQVPSRNDPYDLVADGPTGIEYIVAIASPVPFRDLPWYLTGGYEGRDRGEDYGDDEGYGDSGQIAGDPYVGMDRVVRRVVPRGQEDEVATADTYFYIERKVEYPRYVCADCHSYGGWFDPYGDVCSVVDIRIDAGWAHYRPLRSRVLRPRYFYMVRSTAPTRYRQWKDRWSSVDGRSTLRTRFQVDGTDKFRSRRQIIQRRTPPEFQNLRRPRTEGRVWRPNEVLRRSGDRNDRGDVRDRGDQRGRGDVRGPRNPDRGNARERDNVRQNQDQRRREWQETRDRRQNDQGQRRNQQRQMREQRRDDQRPVQRRDDQRQMKRRDDQRQNRERARSEERPRREDREQARARDDRSQDRGDRGDRGRSEERRRDDGNRGRGQDRRDNDGGRRR